MLEKGYHKEESWDHFTVTEANFALAYPRDRRLVGLSQDRHWIHSVLLGSSPVINCIDETLTPRKKKTDKKLSTCISTVNSRHNSLLAVVLYKSKSVDFNGIISVLHLCEHRIRSILKF